MITDVPRVRVTVPPAGEPVTIGDFKAHARVFDAGDDSYIGGLLPMTRNLLERLQGRAYNTQTLTLTLDRFPCRCPWIELPRAPLQSVTSVVYTLADGVTQVTLDPATYVVDAATEPGRIVLNVGDVWPSDALAAVGAIVITYVSGFSDYRTATVTISNASPAVVDWPAHDLTNGQPVSFSSSADLPSGISADITYYVSSAASGSFHISTTPGGPEVGTTSAGSGTHTARSPGSIPGTILHAIKFLAAHFYQNREALTDIPFKDLPKSFDYLVQQDRVTVVF